MKNIKFLLTAALATTLFSCVNTDNYGAPDLSGKCTDLPVTKQVAAVKAMATSTAQQYTNDDVIEAYVTSSDEGGNFYKSISMVSTDGVTGFTMPIDAYNLYTKYEPGRKVFIKLKDRYIANNSQTASFEIGNLYNATQIGRVTGVEYEEVVKRGCDKVDENTLVNNISIAAAKNNANHFPPERCCILNIKDFWIIPLNKASSAKQTNNKLFNIHSKRKLLSFNSNFT